MSWCARVSGSATEPARTCIIVVVPPPPPPPGATPGAAAPTLTLSRWAAADGRATAAPFAPRPELAARLRRLRRRRAASLSSRARSGTSASRRYGSSSSGSACTWSGARWRARWRHMHQRSNSPLPLRSVAREYRRHRQQLGAERALERRLGARLRPPHRAAAQQLGAGDAVAEARTDGCGAIAGGAGSHTARQRRRARGAAAPAARRRSRSHRRQQAVEAVAAGGVQVGLLGDELGEAAVLVASTGRWRRGRAISTICASASPTHEARRPPTDAARRSSSSAACTPRCTSARPTPRR